MARSRLYGMSLRLPGSSWRGSAGSRSACRYAQPPCNDSVYRSLLHLQSISIHADSLHKSSARCIKSCMMLQCLLCRMRQPC